MKFGARRRKKASCWEAAYFDIPALGENGRSAIWTYERPYDAVADIAGYLAFYSTVVDVAEQGEQAVMG